MLGLWKDTIWSVGRRWLWAGSIGAAMTGTGGAFAQDASTAVREQNAERLKQEYVKLVGACGSDACADDEACAKEADAEKGCADEACAEEGCTEAGCGSGGCRGGGGGGFLFGPDEAYSVNSLLWRDNDAPPFTIGGWTALGYTSRSTGLFNAHPNKINLTQQYLYLERIADGSEGLDYGFRADGIYGVDAQDTQAFGQPAPQGHWDTSFDNGIYGWAVPQLYGEVAYGDLSVKVGHFYTLVGYEVVTAPDNFFYSHSFTMYNSEPFTHTGVLATYNASDNTTLYGGYVLGWDTGFNRFTTGNPGDRSRGSAGIFGFSQAITDNWTMTYVGLAGDMGLNGAGYNHSIVNDFKITDKLTYVLQTDSVNLQQLGSFDVNNFLFYTINDQFAVGAGAEWYKSNLGNLLTGTTANGWESVYVSRVGVNYRPMANLVIRPEYRYQWGAERVITNLAGTNGQPGVIGGVFGMDAILTY